MCLLFLGWPGIPILSVVSIRLSVIVCCFYTAWCCYIVSQMMFFPQLYPLCNKLCWTQYNRSNKTILNLRDTWVLFTVVTCLCWSAFITHVSSAAHQNLDMCQTYLSLISLVFRDNLLLETGFLAILVAPMKMPWSSKLCLHDNVTFWLVRWLLFRLMFASGVVKLTSRCPTWWGLTGEEL